MAFLVQHIVVLPVQISPVYTFLFRFMLLSLRQFQCSIDFTLLLSEINRFHFL